MTQPFSKPLVRALLLAAVVACLAPSPAPAATNSLTGAQWSDREFLNRKIRGWGTFTRSDQTTTLTCVELYVKEAGATNQYQFVGSLPSYVNMMDPNAFPYDGKSTQSRSPTDTFTAKSIARYLHYTEEGGGVWQSGSITSNIVPVR